MKQLQRPKSSLYIDPALRRSVVNCDLSSAQDRRFIVQYTNGCVFVGEGVVSTTPWPLPTLKISVLEDCTTGTGRSVEDIPNRDDET